MAHQHQNERLRQVAQVSWLLTLPVPRLVRATQAVVQAVRAGQALLLLCWQG